MHAKSATPQSHYKRNVDNTIRRTPQFSFGLHAFADALPAQMSESGSIANARLTILLSWPLNLCYVVSTTPETVGMDDSGTHRAFFIE